MVYINKFEAFIEAIRDIAGILSAIHEELQLLNKILAERSE